MICGKLSALSYGGVLGFDKGMLDRDCSRVAHVTAN